jgi:hypothetical protein
MLVKFWTLSLFLFAALSMNAAQAAILESPLLHNEKLVISLSEGTVTLQGSSSAHTVKVNIPDGTESDYQLAKIENTIELRSRDQLSKSDFGKLTK